MGIPVKRLLGKSREAVRWLRDIRSYDPAARRSRRRGPSRVQIQTIDRCNAACIMCPYSALDKTAPVHRMNDELYRRILAEIHRSGTVRRVTLMLQNEPLLDREFAARVRLARQLLGRNVRLSTVTNGSPLTAAVIGELEACGIDHVSVSIDSIREDTFARIRQGLDLHRVLGNTLSLIQRLGPRRVGVKFLRQRENEGQEEEFAAYWRSYGITVSFTEPCNRAGCLESYESIKKLRPDAWKRFIHPILNRCIPACPLPFSELDVLWDGRVILCCNDWGPHDIVGDLSAQTLEEVWNGEQINHYRHLLWTRRASESLVCAGCSQSDRYWKI